MNEQEETQPKRLVFGQDLPEDEPTERDPFEGH